MGIIKLQTRLQRVACIDKNMYVTKALRYSKISSEQLISYASENSGIAKAQMAAAFYAINQQIEQFILNGHSLELGNLGSFYLAMAAKASETEEGAGAEAVERFSLKFRQSKRLRDLLNTSITKATLTDSQTTPDTEEDDEEENTGEDGNGGEETDDPLA